LNLSSLHYWKLKKWQMTKINHITYTFNVKKLWALQVFKKKIILFQPTTKLQEIIMSYGTCICWFIWLGTQLIHHVQHHFKGGDMPIILVPKSTWCLPCWFTLLSYLLMYIIKRVKTWIGDCLDCHTCNYSKLHTNVKFKAIFEINIIKFLIIHVGIDFNGNHCKTFGWILRRLWTRNGLFKWQHYTYHIEKMKIVDSKNTSK